MKYLPSPKGVVYSFLRQQYSMMSERRFIAKHLLTVYIHTPQKPYRMIPASGAFLLPQSTEKLQICNFEAPKDGKKLHFYRIWRVALPNPV